MPIFYGDIHNHNAHGYGVGSIERSLDVARTHLDFFAFTGHSSWHDMPAMEGGRERHWIEGFKRLKETWPRVQQVIADGNRDGEFCAFLGFERNCLVAPGFEVLEALLEPAGGATIEPDDGACLGIAVRLLSHDSLHDFAVHVFAVRIVAGTQVYVYRNRPCGCGTHETHSKLKLDASV